jgi:uncharacterized protein (TIGR04255 family)
MSIATLAWLDLDVPPRVVFERTPLALALCQVRYAPMLGVSNPATVAPFQQAIIDEYPVSSQDQNVNIRVEGSLNQASIKSNVGSISWRFTDTVDTWTTVLTPEFVALETRVYSDFSEFLSRLDRVLRVLAKHIRPPIGQRIGLRYVNEIRPGHSDWASIICPELLGALAVSPIAAYATQSIQQIQLRGPDGVGVNLQHGAIPGGTVVQPRPGADPAEGPFYLLDIDVFQEFKPGSLTVKAGVIRDRVERYHDIVSRLFRWSVSEAYTATLGRRLDGTG